MKKQVSGTASSVAFTPLQVYYSRIHVDIPTVPFFGRNFDVKLTVLIYRAWRL